MDKTLRDTSYIFDFRDELRLLRQNPGFTLSYEQVDELVNFLLAEMELDIRVTLNKILVWGEDKFFIPANFQMMNPEQLEMIRSAMYETATLLWLKFKSKGMFDYNNSGNTSFPFVAEDVVGSNIVLLKDNVISSNKVNEYG